MRMTDQECCKYAGTPFSYLLIGGTPDNAYILMEGSGIDVIKRYIQLEPYLSPRIWRKNRLTQEWELADTPTIEKMKKW